MTGQQDLCTPWMFLINGYGTDQYAVITDAARRVLASADLPNSTCPAVTDRWGSWWLPEDDERHPLITRQMRVMAAAPMMLEAIRATLGSKRCTLTHRCRRLLQAAITEATGEQFSKT